MFCKYHLTRSEKSLRSPHNDRVLTARKAEVRTVNKDEGRGRAGSESRPEERGTAVSPIRSAAGSGPSCLAQNRVALLASAGRAVPSRD